MNGAGTEQKLLNIVMRKYEVKIKLIEFVKGVDLLFCPEGRLPL